MNEELRVEEEKGFIRRKHRKTILYEHKNPLDDIKMIKVEQQQRQRKEQNGKELTQRRVNNNRLPQHIAKKNKGSEK